MLIHKDNFEFIHLSSIDSTNNYAKKLCSLGFTNKVIIADTQTAGRTTKEQKWISPKGNLYFSIILNLKDEKNLPEYSFLSAISIVQSINQIDTNSNIIKVKWPNDVLLNKQKFCGILIEKEKDKVIIGIGVNTISSPAQNLTRYPTTNLHDNKIEISPQNLAELILKNLIQNINLKESESFEKIISLITPYMYKFNEKVYISTQKETLIGIFSGLSKDGALLLTTPKQTYTIFSGEMTKENFI